MVISRVLGLPWRVSYCIALLSLLVLVATPAPPAQASATTNFYSGFEPGDTQPKWQNTPETDLQGQAKISGVTGSSAEVGTGPGSPASRQGRTRLSSLGTRLARGAAMRTTRSSPSTCSSPRRPSCRTRSCRRATPGAERSEQYASVDLHFTDGTYLSELGAEDQYFVKLDPEDMGASDTLYPDVWNQVVSTIGSVAAGKTIDRILVAYDNPNGAAGASNPPMLITTGLTTSRSPGTPAQSTSDPVEYHAGSPSDYVYTYPRHNHSCEDSGTGAFPPRRSRTGSILDSDFLAAQTTYSSGPSTASNTPRGQRLPERERASSR